MHKLLILNPGSTSTKISIYEDSENIFTESITHSSEELAPFDKVIDQLDFRTDIVFKVLNEKNIDINSLTAIVARGGVLPPIKAGGYRINEDMIWQLKYAPIQEHASNLGAVIAHKIAIKNNIPAFIYDGVTVDEMLPILKYTGIPEIQRKGIGHNLNTRAAAMRYANENNKSYKECKLVVVHLGGGISITLQYGGRIADIINDEDGPFAPERAGGLPSQSLISYMETKKLSTTQMLKLMKSQGGLVAYLGVNDARKVEQMIADGDSKAKEIYEAMALNVARKIGEEATTVAGDIEGIILTGGMAYSNIFVDLISKKVDWIAPVTVYPGENEMESLALGGLRILSGEEDSHTYKKHN